MKTFSMLILFFVVTNLIDVTEVKADIVNPKQTYTYEMMQRDIKLLEEKYPQLISTKIIGKSEYGRNIYAVSLGTGRSTVLINGSHHGREWLTTNLNMHMIDQYAQAFTNNQSIGGYSARTVLTNSTIWFVPMVNPDGVSLQQKGLSAIPSSEHAALLKMNNGSRDFRSWKANGKGIDLNRQYNAGWAQIKGPTRPTYMNFKGYSPQSASEVKAMVQFTHEVDPEMSIAYHSSGEILFWNYLQTGSRYQRDLAYARQVGKMTSYSLVFPGPNPSGGGMTDWFIQEFKRPGFTPELGKYAGATHLPISAYDRVWQQNQQIGLYAAHEGHKLFQKRVDGLATAQVKSSQLLANDLVRMSRIRSNEDLVLSQEFLNEYQLLRRQIRRTEDTIENANKSRQAWLNDQLDYAEGRMLQVASVIDAVNVSADLKKATDDLQLFIASETLNDESVAAYHFLSSEIRRQERAIGRVYGANDRSIMNNAFVLPAKIKREAMIFEVTLYELYNRAEEQLAAGNLEEVERELSLSDRIERRAIEIKAAGNELHPGQYPDLKAMQDALAQWELDLIQRLELAKTPLADDVSSASLDEGEKEIVEENIEVIEESTEQQEEINE